MSNNFTQEEIDAAKAARLTVIQFGSTELKSTYMAGEICMWDEMKQSNKELVEALMEVSPLLDGLINRTPTGKQREELCDMNIKVKSALAAHTPKG